MVERSRLADVMRSVPERKKRKVKKAKRKARLANYNVRYGIRPNVMPAPIQTFNIRHIIETRTPQYHFQDVVNNRQERAASAAGVGEQEIRQRRERARDPRRQEAARKAMADAREVNMADSSIDTTTPPPAPAPPTPISMRSSAAQTDASPMPTPISQQKRGEPMSIGELEAPAENIYELLQSVDSAANRYAGELNESVETDVQKPPDVSALRRDLQGSGAASSFDSQAGVVKFDPARKAPEGYQPHHPTARQRRLAGLFTHDDVPASPARSYTSSSLASDLAQTYYPSVYGIVPFPEKYSR